MAAYGALVSVMQIVDQIHRHPHPPISLHKQQVESLTANVTYLQEFLEGYNPHLSYSAEADPLESRIAEAAYAAEDVIESYIVDQIHARSTDHVEEISSHEFYQGLQKVIEEMDLIKMQIKKEMKEKKMGVQIIKKSTTDTGSSRSSSTAQKVTTMVGLDEVLIEMLDKITGGGVGRQIIPIVGMGGLGKTTLARSVYVNPLTKEHFDICAWSTISQVYNGLKILREILGQVDIEDKDRGDLSEYDLGEELYRYLIGRRYFIVMDDMWSIEAWDRLRKFFPDNENGSRIVITTRLSNLASMFNYSNGLHMKFLDETSSWNLFNKTVFGEENCPLELEDIGKKIVKGCKGLPLSIVVIGGLLAKSEQRLGNWELIQKNLNSNVNSEDEGSCLQILYTSYNNLPCCIKSCFLYMGIFDEDDDIPTGLLIPLWIAEGFIKPCDGKSLEEVGEEYLEELTDRNLVLVEEHNHYGKLKSCKIHDLLRNLCLREGEKDKFLGVFGEERIPQGISCQRRIATTFSGECPPTSLIESLEPAASLVRSLLGTFPKTVSISSCRLLRVCLILKLQAEEEISDEYYEEIFIRLVNLRLLIVDVEEHPLSRIPPSASFLWNLQTLYLFKVDDNYVLEIWKMPQLRHVKSVLAALCLSVPPLNGDDMDEVVVMENLHTLSAARNLMFSEEVLKRIPNIKKLRLDFDETREKLGDYCLHNLHRLCKLQLLGLRISYSSKSFSLRLMRELTLPYSLKKLVLKGTKLPWEDMKAKIGCLPLLQVLKLKEDSFMGSEWETVEGQFSALKFLHIEFCDLKYWITENTHFPRLEHLHLFGLKKLSEIPSSIGDIPTLRSIMVKDCSDSVVESARRIVEEQKELGNEDIQLQLI